jgi:hypothetical protein
MGDDDGRILCRLEDCRDQCVEQRVVADRSGIVLGVVDVVLQVRRIELDSPLEVNDRVFASPSDVEVGLGQKHGHGSVGAAPVVCLVELDRPGKCCLHVPHVAEDRRDPMEVEPLT